jgi:hypothetical protein
VRKTTASPTRKKVRRKSTARVTVS